MDNLEPLQVPEAAPLKPRQKWSITKRLILVFVGLAATTGASAAIYAHFYPEEVRRFTDPNFCPGCGMG